MYFIISNMSTMSTFKVYRLGA